MRNRALKLEDYKKYIVYILAYGLLFVGMMTTSSYSSAEQIIEIPTEVLLNRDSRKEQRTHQKEILTQEQKFKNATLILQQAHQEKILKLEQKHENATLALQQAHQKAILGLKRGHKIGILNLQQTHRKEILNLEQELKNATIILKQMLRKEILAQKQEPEWEKLKQQKIEWRDKLKIEAYKACSCIFNFCKEHEFISLLSNLDFIEDITGSTYVNIRNSCKYHDRTQQQTVMNNIKEQYKHIINRPDLE